MTHYDDMNRGDSAYLTSMQSYTSVRAAGKDCTDCMQLAHEEEKSNLFTSRTNDWWRLIRKGLSPAFSANNLRCNAPISGGILHVQPFYPYIPPSLGSYQADIPASGLTQPGTPQQHKQMRHLAQHMSSTCKSNLRKAAA